MANTAVACTQQQWHAGGSFYEGRDILHDTAALFSMRLIPRKRVLARKHDYCSSRVS